MKYGQMFDNMNGKIRVSSGELGTLHPYMKMFLRRLCPWKSVKMSSSLSLTPGGVEVVDLVAQLDVGLQHPGAVEDPHPAGGDLSQPTASTYQQHS